MQSGMGQRERLPGLLCEAALKAFPQALGDQQHPSVTAPLSAMPAAGDGQEGEEQGTD